MDNMDNREIYYHSDDTLFRCGLFRLCGLCGLKKNLPPARDPISCQKGADLALTRKLADGTYLTYFPFASLTEESKMTPYHKKLLQALELNCKVTHQLCLPNDLHTACDLVATVVYVLKRCSDNVHVVVCV